MRFQLVRTVGNNLRNSPIADALRSRLFVPVDIACLVYFRIAFYGIMLWEVWRFIDHDWVRRYFTDKEFYFTYWPFDFLRPLPGDGMMILFYCMGAAAAFAALGLFYRVSAGVFFLMITYVFLLEQARYLNHLYLVCLIAFLMIFVPAHRYFSLDALLNPKMRSEVVPAWSIWLLRFQVGIPMLFGGIAKLNADWLRGEPLRAWLADRTDFPILGQYFTYELLVWFLNYSGLFIDLFVVFLLVNRRTRVFGFVTALAFHFMNARLFDIGIFPWLMIAATVLFFEPDWPRRMLRDLRQGHAFRAPALIGGFSLGFFIGGLLPETFSLVKALVGAVGVAIAAYHLDEPFRRPEAEPVGVKAEPAMARRARVKAASRSPAPPVLTLVQKWTFALLGVWLAVQVLVPLRHFAIPGNVHWTEEGHNFSWHMKLRDKDSAGLFVASDPSTGEQWEVNPLDYLTSRQTRKMTSRPHMVIPFVHYLEDRFREEGHQDVEIRARIFASLNGREAQLLIDPEVDLTKVSHPWWGHADWILPLELPLRSSN